MNPNIIQNDSDLANILLRSCPKEGFFLISIDGLNQAGKSTLAKNLVKLMDTECIEVYHYLEKHKGGYIDYIRYNDLRESINRIRQKSRVLIIDGICILEILNRIGIKPAITNENTIRGLIKGFNLNRFVKRLYAYLITNKPKTTDIINPIKLPTEKVKLFPN